MPPSSTTSCPLASRSASLLPAIRPGRGPGEITAAAGVGDGEVLIGRICLEVDRAAVGLAGRGLLRPPRAGEGDDELRHRRRRGLPHGGRGGRTDEFDRLAFGGLAAKMGLVPPERHNQRIAGAVERELLASDGPARGGGERTTAIVGLDGVTVGERRRVEVELARLAAEAGPAATAQPPDIAFSKSCTDCAFAAPANSAAVPIAAANRAASQPCRMNAPHDAPRPAR